MISLKTRLKCPHSYAKDDIPDLLCDIGYTKCDGTLHDDCLASCGSFAEEMELIAENERNMEVQE